MDLQASPVESVPCATAGASAASLSVDEGSCLGAILEFGLALAGTITAYAAAGAATGSCASAPIVANCALAAYLIAQAEQATEQLASAAVRMDRECLDQEEFLASLSPRVVALAQH
jgi:hypothetical protein